MKKALWILAIVLVLLIIITISIKYFSLEKTKNNQDNNTFITPNITTYHIDIINNSFSPSQVTIKKGDRVSWINKDSSPHTITSDIGSKFNSSVQNYRDIYSKTLNTPGVYDYHCSIHPYMKGKIIVE